MKKICLAVLVLAVACTKNLHREHQPEVVIESYLLPGQPVYVKLNWEIPWGADPNNLMPLEEIKPILKQNQTVHSLTHMGNGLYANPNISLQGKDSCYLSFEANGRKVSAFTVIPGKPTGFVCNTDTVKNPRGWGYDPVAVTFNWDNPGNDYHLMVIKYPGAHPWWGTPLPANSLPSAVGYVKPTKEKMALVQCSDYFFSQTYIINLFRIQPDYAIMFNQTHNSLLEVTGKPHNITNGYGIFTGMNMGDSVAITIDWR